MEISGKTALITGATGGIGHAIARGLRGAGASLILTGRRTDVLEPLAAETGARSFAVDLSDATALDGLIAECADVDILVANAGLPGTGLIEDYSVADLDRCLDVNLRAPMMLSRALVPAMRSRGNGHLVFISSLAGKASAPRSGIYNATKFGLRGFSHALREDLVGSGVSASVICPGFISDAGMFADAEIELPRGVGTRTPDQVADAVLRCIRDDVAEISVAPAMMRALSTFAGAVPGVAGRLSRRMGAGELSAELAQGQTAKR